MRYALLAVAVFVLSGCFPSTPSYVVKQKSIEKSPDGVITKTIETEYVIQAVSLEEITLEILKIERAKRRLTQEELSSTPSRPLNE